MKRLKPKARALKSVSRRSDIGRPSAPLPFVTDLAYINKVVKDLVALRDEASMLNDPATQLEYAALALRLFDAALWPVISWATDAIAADAAAALKSRDGAVSSPSSKGQRPRTAPELQREAWAEITQRIPHLLPGARELSLALRKANLGEKTAELSLSRATRPQRFSDAVAIFRAVRLVEFMKGMGWSYGEARELVGNAIGLRPGDDDKTLERWRRELSSSKGRILEGPSPYTPVSGSPGRAASVDVGVEFERARTTGRRFKNLALADRLQLIESELRHVVDLHPVRRKAKKLPTH